jgi:hypothetical protein
MIYFITEGKGRLKELKAKTKSCAKQAFNAASELRGSQI